jgi:uncharacterized delta-60 repeat protein
MPTSFKTFIAISALLLVDAARVWAGPGDIDAAFGTSGRLELMTEVSLVLPDDRLMVAYNAGNLIVARLDENGQVDPSYGEGGPTLPNGGETRVPLPGAWPRFYPYYASATPDGGIVFAGPLRDFELDVFVEAVLRLDRDGHLVTSFGGRGDGYFRLTDAPVDSLGLLPTRLMAIAVDPNGRVLLALRSWTADGRCNGPTRIMRLTSSGRPDAAFGTNGRAEVPGVDLCDGAALFGARNDGSIVVGAHGAIVGLDATGALDAAFGVGGHVSRELSRGFLLPDGGVLIAHADSSTTASNATFTKLDRGGQLDSTFGAGTGSAQLDFGANFFGISGSHQLVHDFVLTPDAAHMYLKLSVQHLDGTIACVGGIARLFLDGTPDNSFGRHGLTCLDYGAFGFSLVAAQRNGSPLFGTTSALYRLLTDATPSPGIFTVIRNGRLDFGEGVGTVTVPLAVRTAGRDGAVSVSFSSGPRHLNDDDGSGPPSASDAAPGSDFEVAPGRLDWADGDESEREVTVTILDDDVGESGNERFSIGIFEPQGGALTPREYVASVDVGIIDDDEAVAGPTNPPPTNPPPTSPGSSSGGGSLSWTTLFVVAALSLARERRRRRHGSHPVYLGQPD